MSENKTLLQLADFGISQIHSTAGMTMSGTQQGHGQAPYMAKELLMGQKYTNKDRVLPS